MQENIHWTFPLPRTHTGIMLGNATTGLLIWGEKSHLKITLGRADLWDHRGGMSWTERQNYRDLKKYLLYGNFQAIKDMFIVTKERISGHPNHLSVTPLGRLDLLLGNDTELKTGKLNIKTGVAEIYYTQGNSEKKISVQISMEQQTFIIDLPSENDIEIMPIPSWQINPDLFKRLLFESSIFLKDKTLKGWTQKFPNDPPVTVAYTKDNSTIFAITERTDNIDTIRQTLSSICKEGKKIIEQETKNWWKRFWNKVPKIDIPNHNLDFIYSYGLYKFACFTNPSGIPATLQGPWIEEYELPPWSSDYHFNINVQMCYWPAYKANCLEHLMPMFNMVWSWRDKLRANAKAFIGIDDGFILPHAVDDEGTCMGGFWTGTIDQGCAAWIAQMMFLYYKYTGEIDFLENIAFPFMKGVMRVYEEMLEEKDGQYCLSISVSPEYRGSQMNAWGANASFQLAAIHRLCEDLIQAANILKEKPADSWLKISQNLPKATLIGENTEKRIALWQDTDLEESHRHHSHLAAICPFDTIDIHSDKWTSIIENSINHWIEMGMGLWSGWCMTWASMIHSRLGNGEMAELLLEIWKRVFTNEGYSSLHDPVFPGFSLINAPFTLKKESRTERMQMDAAMGAITAIQDMLMHTQRNVLYILPAIPNDWKNVSFKDMPTEGGFSISAEKIDGSLQSVSIYSKRAGILKIANPWPNKCVKATISANDNISENINIEKTEKIFEGNIFDISLAENENCILNCT